MNPSTVRGTSRGSPPILTVSADQSVSMFVGQDRGDSNDADDNESCSKSDQSVWHGSGLPPPESQVGDERLDVHLSHSSHRLARRHRITASTLDA